jgi:uncharacterized protein
VVKRGLAVLLLLAALPALAQTAQQQKIDPAKEADIRRLLDVTGSKKLMDQVMTYMWEQLKPSLGKSLPPGDRSQKIVDAFFQKFQVKFTSEFYAGEILSIYDKHFSAEDIKGLLQFYESPLGQRALKALPQVARETQLAGAQLGQKIAQEVIEEMQEEYPELKQGQKTPPANP